MYWNNQNCFWLFGFQGMRGVHSVLRISSTILDLDWLAPRGSAKFRGNVNLAIGASH